jgi:hypothetical protein
VTVGVGAAKRPRHGPAVGQILDLDSGDVRYRGTSLRFQVADIREDISRGYGGSWLWLEGYELHPTEGYEMTWLQILVSVDAIQRHTGATCTDHRTSHTGRTPVHRWPVLATP